MVAIHLCEVGLDGPDPRLSLIPSPLPGSQAQGKRKKGLLEMEGGEWWFQPLGGHLGWRDPLLSESHTSPTEGPPWCRGWGLTQTWPCGWRAGPAGAKVLSQHPSPELPPPLPRKGGFYFEPRAVAQNRDFYLSLLRPALVSRGTPPHRGPRAFHEAGS